MPDAADPNRRTLAAYERYARQYAAAVPAQPPAGTEDALRRFVSQVDALPAPHRVLEIGSGPGWDADFVEALGCPVHRTDATGAFRAFQQQRGRHVDALDLLTDPIAGRYAGAMLLCVLQHFERDRVDAVLCKLAAALVKGGALLLSHFVGDDEGWEHGESGDYRVVRWPPEVLDARLAEAGFAVCWQATGDDGDGPWRSVIAQRRGG